MQFKSDAISRLALSALKPVAAIILFWAFSLSVASQAAALTAVCGVKEPVPAAVAAHLTKTAEDLGLGYPRAFAGVVATIQRTGRAPDCYLTKQQARQKGWQRGRDLCLVAPNAAAGIAIGKTRFENREGLLPKIHEGAYRIVDLDFDCGRRGAKRLVYVRDAPGEWLLWVTLDHYDSFIPISPPK